MTQAPVAIDAPLEDLLAALDETVALQEEVLGHLESAAQAVSRLDDEALGRMMHDLDQMPARLEEAERRRHRARVRLAEALGRPVREVTLGRLERDLPAADADRVGRRRRRLQDLADAVRRRHLRTAVFVGEAARVSRSLLAALVPTTAGARTYGTDGSPVRTSGQAMLDARL